MARSGTDLKMAKLLASAAICKNGGVTDWYQRHGYREQVISSSNHPIIIPSDSDIEDSFSSTNVLDYFLAAPGNTSPDSSNDLTKYLFGTSSLLTFTDESMPPKRTSTSAAPAMTQAAIRQLVVDSVAAALETTYNQYPISTLETTLEDIQVRHQLYMKDLLKPTS
ncbi:hypothetical protein Tco_0487080 [Tanacetum coccineum]